MRSMSPTRTSRAGFASISLERMRPMSHALAASARVLKKRAAQSHLSMRTEFMMCVLRIETRGREGASGCALGLPDVKKLRVAGGCQLNPSLARRPIQSGTDIFLGVRQRLERDL